MKKLFIFLVFTMVAISILWTESSCKREPVYVGELVTKDTLGGIDTTVVVPIDTADYTGTPCSPDTVYFQNSVLPLLVSNCALSGCHDAVTHKEGINLTSYAKVISTGKVKPYYPLNSKMYTSLSSNSERMPPAPAPEFTVEQKAIIQKWIAQGALNNVCNENYGQGCSTIGVTYTNFIKPLVSNQCLGCHSNTSTGGGLLLKTYTDVIASAQTGKFYDSIVWKNGVSAMPKNGTKLSACYADKVKAWVDSGMPQ